MNMSVEPLIPGATLPGFLPSIKADYRLHPQKARQEKRTLLVQPSQAPQRI